MKILLIALAVVFVIWLLTVFIQKSDKRTREKLVRKHQIEKKKEEEEEAQDQGRIRH